MESPADRVALVVDVARAAVSPLGLGVEDVTITPAGRRRVVRISVDTDVADLDPGDETSAIPPVTLDAVADATRAINAALDEVDALGNSPYVLEVTSPGVGRPLTEPQHFRRNVGRLVELILTDRSVCEGRLVAAGATGVRVDVPATGTAPAQQREVPLDDISRARVQVEFAREEED